MPCVWNKSSSSVFCSLVSSRVLNVMLNDLPKEYKVVKVTEQADKVKIKEALKDGESILGCELVTNQNIQIK